MSRRPEEKTVLGWFVGVPLVVLAVMVLGNLLGGGVFWRFFYATGFLWVLALVGLCFAIPSLRRQNGCMVSLGTLLLVGFVVSVTVVFMKPQVETPPRSSDHLLVYPRLRDPLKATVDGVRLRMKPAEVEAAHVPPTHLENAPSLTVRYDEGGLVEEVRGAVLREHPGGRVVAHTGMLKDRLREVSRDLGLARLHIQISGREVLSVGLEFTPPNRPDRGAYLVDGISLEMTAEEVATRLGPPGPPDPEGFFTYPAGTRVRFAEGEIQEVRGSLLTRSSGGAKVKKGDPVKAVFTFFGWKNVTNRTVFRYPGLEMNFLVPGDVVEAIELQRVAYP